MANEQQPDKTKKQPVDISDLSETDTDTALDAESVKGGMRARSGLAGATDPLDDDEGTGE
jgi:hypothetical protein